MALLASMVMAQQADFDKAVVLRELDKLEQLHKERVTVEQKNIRKALENALSNTKALLDLYQEAVYATRFEGGKKDSSDFRKWKKDQEDILKADDFQAILAMHVSYLYLTLLRASGEDIEKINEALIRHVSKVWAAEGKFDFHKQTNAELLDRPVTQGVLARRYQLGQKLGGPQEGELPKDQEKTWEWLPANTDGMLDKTVFPFLRKKKSPVLITIWETRIANEAARVKRLGLNDKAAQFTQQTLPKLNWQRARDLVLLRREAEGFSTMIEILRQYANHAEFDKYAGELRNLLAGGEALSAEQSE
ncbi:MAG: hypothetical protein WCK89_14655 [bacterium]